MSSSIRNWLVAAGFLAAVATAIYFATRPIDEEDGRWRSEAAAVAVAPITIQDLDQVRSFTGTLESRAKFIVAPKVAGRVMSLPFDLADPVQRGEPVAFLDDAEFNQEVKQAEADLAVAEANLAEAISALEISRRENQRSATLRARGIASAAEFDTSQADLLAREAKVKVAEAQVIRAESSLQTARIRLGYTRIDADWNEGDSQRVIAERYIDEGETVSANEPLLLIVDMDPITAVINVTERDYGLMQPGMEAEFVTDAIPGEVFSGKVERISPVFSSSSRQARVELSLANPGDRLKPGMFVRADLTLSSVQGATVVPEDAITRRSDADGVFIVSDDQTSVRWQEIKTGVRANGMVQVESPDIAGRVVTLGQHLLEDGSAVVVPDESTATAAR